MMTHSFRLLKNFMPIGLEIHLATGVYDVLAGFLTLDEQLPGSKWYDLHGYAATGQNIQAIEDCSADIVGGVEVEDGSGVLKRNHIQTPGAFTQ